MASKAELSISLGKLAKQLRIHHRIICNCLERKGKSLNINSQISSIGIETIILRFSKNDMPQKFSKTYNNQEKTNLQKALGKN